MAKEASRAFQLTQQILDSLSAFDETPLSLPTRNDQALEVKSQYTRAQVATFIAAACLAHFILVVGGFTGDRGYAKWLAVEDRFASLWHAHAS